MPLQQHLIAKTAPCALAENIIVGKGFRITVLTDSLFRVEVSDNDVFSDSATQMVWFRNLSAVKFSTETVGSVLKIITEKVTLFFDTAAKKATAVILPDGVKSSVNNSGNLKGTARTLDMSVGNFQMLFPDWLKRPWIFHLEFCNGVVGTNGVAVIPDNSLRLGDNGELSAAADEKDAYIFAYGKDYRAAVKALFAISGEVPMLPRYALGNWWSRYKAYSQQEYVDLMQRFIDSKIPVTVATIDMDWHWVNVKRFGKVPMGWSDGRNGWTGYSWNTDLFPDYKAFLKWLKDNNFRITVNLHPASGVRCFEDMYEGIAREMGIDPTTKQAVKFDIADPRFVNAYFKYLHKPYEKDGVDFWWIDWQQGKDPAVWGLDPLWSLNHYHYLDDCVDADGNSRRGLILSRYAGAGSHRYPLGFSGDTFVRWTSLKFQPYFTANATNIGYTWWSHDIGGHMFGINDFELYMRWIQLGVFSPINRLHSTSAELMGKEPWKRRKDIEIYTTELLRLRHRLIPYLYTMNRRTNSEGLALCEPMYYSYPDANEAYDKSVRNQYMFGSEMMVCPITSKTDKRTGLASVKAWLPKGRWTDFFTGTVYEGNNNYLELFRDLSDIPVLIKAGGIVPLSSKYDTNDSGNPADMDIAVYRGNGVFKLYEDKGDGMDYEEHNAITVFRVNEKDKDLIFRIEPAKGDLAVIPTQRNYTVQFRDIVTANVTVKVNNKDFAAVIEDKTLSVKLNGILPTDTVEITVSNYTVIRNLPLKERAIELCSRYQGSNINHLIRFLSVQHAADDKAVAAAIRKSTLPVKLKKAVLETESVN